MTPIIRKRKAPSTAIVSGEQQIAALGHNSATGLSLQIQYVAPDTIRIPERELRRHPKKQIAQIEASIRRFGHLQPLIIDSQSTIVCGIARFLASKSLQLARVPVIRVEHLTDDELRVFRLADNKLAEGASWNADILAVELGELLLVPDCEIELTGFDTVEIEQLTLAAQPLATETEEIEEPSPGPSVARDGDLFRIGNHMLLCGDARKGETYVTLMGKELARMVFGDLPYNVKIQRNVSGLGKVKHGEFVAGSGELSRSEFIAFKREIMEQLAAFSVAGSIHFLCMDWRHQLEMIQAGEAVYDELKNMLVWCKTNAGLGTFYRSQYELIYAWKSGTAPHINNFGLGEAGRYRTNVLTYPGCNTFRKGRNEDLALHSTVKPTQLVADLIRDVSKLGEIVLDPCSGSGTTILAAERVKRRAHCIELDPKYVDATIKRCRDKLGLEAVHVETGLAFDALAEQRLGMDEAASQEDVA